MKKLFCAIAAAALFVVAAPSSAAPKAINAAECQYFWDVAITARAIAMDDIPLERNSRILARMFETRGDRRVDDIIREIIAAAHRSATAVAGEFARSLATVCLQRNGDMDDVLGTGRGV